MKESLKILVVFCMLLPSVIPLTNFSKETVQVAKVITNGHGHGG